MPPLPFILVELVLFVNSTVDVVGEQLLYVGWARQIVFALKNHLSVQELILSWIIFGALLAGGPLQSIGQAIRVQLGYPLTDLDHLLKFD